MKAVSSAVDKRLIALYSGGLKQSGPSYRELLTFVLTASSAILETASGFSIACNSSGVD